MLLFVVLKGLPVTFAPRRVCARVCAGKFFADGRSGDSIAALNPYLKGEREVPVPTFFICADEVRGQTALIDRMPEGGTLARNLHYLGPRVARACARVRVCMRVCLRLRVRVYACACVCVKYFSVCGMLCV